MVIPKGVEPLIFWMRTRRPGPLDDGTTYVLKFNRKQIICKAWALPLLKQWSRIVEMKYIKRYWQIIFPIIIMIIIWNFSAQNSFESDGISIPLAEKLGLTNHVVRKLAHFTIYALLGLSWANFFRSINKKFPTIVTAALSLLPAVVYALIDEYHQNFIFGRDGNFTDVVIDSLGAITGICIFITIFCFIKRRKIIKKH